MYSPDTYTGESLAHCVKKDQFCRTNFGGPWATWRHMAPKFKFKYRPLQRHVIDCPTYVPSKYVPMSPTKTQLIDINKLCL